jgi:lipopolysaccharide heptosyltransferase II
MGSARSQRSGLQIHDAKERRLVAGADAVLSPLRWLHRAKTVRPIRRVLLLRLERIGDLLMVLDAIRDARHAWPNAEIDLAVGRWNAPLASLIPCVDHVHVASVPWLARGEEADSWGGLVSKAREWRSHGYDLVLNFEPDIRSNALAWLTRAPRRVGYGSGGGGAFLTDALTYEPDKHVRDNARQVIASAAGGTSPADASSGCRLEIPAEATERARRILSSARRPLVGVHASGGRASKQWYPRRFGEVAASVARSRNATIVLTGGPGDRALVDELKPALNGLPVIDVVGALDIVDLAALLAELDVLVTGDTGPMHLAAAMTTPVVALFGPSNPVRYGPLGTKSRVLRIDLPCSPCGQVRQPPERCRGHVPDCLHGIDVDRVVAAVDELLN